MSQEIFKSDNQKVQLLNEGPQSMRLVTSETKQIITQQPVIEISQQKTLIQTQNEAPLKQIQQLPPPRIQSQNVLRQNMQIPQVSYPGTYSVQQNCQQAPPLCMNLVVVSKEEIETPWRLECEYLQSIIADLERRKEGKVVEKVVVEKVTDNTRVEQLESQLRSLRSENENLKSQMMQMRNNYESQIQSLRGDISLHSANAADANSMQAEFFALRTQLEDQIAGLRRQLADLELLYAQSQSDNERLKQLNQNKDAEIQQLRLQLSQLQTSAQDTSQLRDLENQLRLARDEISRLERQLQQANQDILNWKNKYTTIEQESYSKNNELIMQLRDLENKLAMVTVELDRLQAQLQSKDSELEDWRYRYTQLESQGTTVIQEKVTYLSQEVEVWKQKFIKTNHEYNKCQEELTMCQAELESLKKSQQKKVINNYILGSGRDLKNCHIKNRQHFVCYRRNNWILILNKKNRLVRVTFSFIQEYQFMIQSEIYDIEAYMQIGQDGYQFLKKIAPLTQENQWQPFSEEGGFKIHIRPDPETGLCLTRGEGFLPYTVDEIFAIIEDIPIRPKYDGICESGQIIRRFSDELMLFYQKFKSMFFVISSRDFVVISRKIVEGDFTYAIGKSLEHPNHPPIKGVVRGDLKIGGWILEKREGGTFCIFVTWADPKGMLPKKAVNIVAGAQGKVVQQIKLLLDERKKNVNK